MLTEPINQLRFGVRNVRLAALCSGTACVPSAREHHFVPGRVRGILRDKAAECREAPLLISLVSAWYQPRTLLRGRRRELIEQRTETDQEGRLRGRWWHVLNRDLSTQRLCVNCTCRPDTPKRSVARAWLQRQRAPTRTVRAGLSVSSLRKRADNVRPVSA